MNRRYTNWLIVIIILIIISAFIVSRDSITIPNPFNGQTLFTRNTAIRLGLDLRGGLQTLLEADVPADSQVSAQDLAITRQILENRANIDTGAYATGNLTLLSIQGSSLLAV